MEHSRVCADVDVMNYYLFPCLNLCLSLSGFDWEIDSFPMWEDGKVVWVNVTVIGQQYQNRGVAYVECEVKMWM